MNEPLTLESLQQEVENIKELIYSVQKELIKLKENLNGSIKATIKASCALRDGIVLTEGRIDAIELACKLSNM